MKYDVIFFTDMTDRSWHIKPLGAFRLATELRKHGYTAKVIDLFSTFCQGDDITKFEINKILDHLVGENTLFLGFSSTFFGEDWPDDIPVPPNMIERTAFKNKIQSVYPFNRVKFAEWCALLKQKYPNVKLVFGGSGVNATTHINEYVDYNVIGISDVQVINLVEHLKYGKSIQYMPQLINGVKTNTKLISFDEKGFQFDFSNQSKTVWEETDHVMQGEVLPIEISRGCLFKCKFCSYPLLGRSKNDPAYKKNVDLLADELRENYEKFGVTRYSITDDTLNESTEKLLMIQESIKKSGVNIEFFAYLRVDLLYVYQEQIPLLREMGLRSAFFGIETLNEKSGKAIGKGLHPDKIKEALQICRNIWGSEVSIYTSFISGLPYETPETLTNSMNYIVYESPVDDFGCTPLMFNKFEGVWTSEFSKNAEDYGYEISYSEKFRTWIWKNENWTLKTAYDAATNFFNEGVTANRKRIASIDIIGLMNSGYNYHDIRDKKLSDLNFETLKQKYAQYVNAYKNLLYNYENIT